MAFWVFPCMDTLTAVRPDNDVIAGRIIALIASTRTAAPDYSAALSTEIKKLLDHAYPSRRASSAAKDGHAAWRNGDLFTSAEAARSVKVPELERVVLRTLQNSISPMTADEVGVITDIPYKTISPRFKPLRQKGLIRVVGTDSSSGRRRTTYMPTIEGRFWLRNCEGAA